MGLYCSCQLLMDTNLALSNDESLSKIVRNI